MGLANDTRTYQVFFNLFGYSAKALNGGLLDEDNKPGPVTRKVTEKYQEIKGIVKDGVIGNQTRKEIIKDFQDSCNQKGISKAALKGLNLSVDGVDGKVTEDVILYIQKQNGLLQDKILGSITLKAMAGMKAKPSTVAGWTKVYYTKSSQNLSFNCGPASLRIGMSQWGHNLSIDWLTIVSKADSNNGTSIENMLKAVAAINGEFGKNYKARSETFKSWETLEGYLKQNNIVIIRSKSWKTNGEHYTTLAGIHRTSTGVYDYVELGDPSNSGYRLTTTTDLLNKIKGVSVASVIVITK